ncbi:hypothetical protein PPL_00238 [Heterostelium album PN500]|uniref:Uncharacterized protein n=1 Tax=Heterostelium pallidum (strain ATCC 26659 / Pp 5 / PN500) TaxID=670386 RepID=D3AVX2_HETP5|nr:hypothetical protein PPL_00238 [Heterostelium album PN500]EFA86445.1 hypothetical protein PPL_00238 [Heterostelium album PN500]|eukprot:XP_020438550.1 hypothetical protein PPL_00238 [Heterostelium album PN500]
MNNTVISHYFHPDNLNNYELFQSNNKYPRLFTVITFFIKQKKCYRKRTTIILMYSVGFEPTLPKKSVP